MGPSITGILAALAAVLASVVAGGVLLRRWMGRDGGFRPDRLRVTDRASLGPRQGVATVRVGSRTALVSYGEGGVRLLLSLPANELDGVEGDEVGEGTRSERAESPGGDLRKAGACGSSPAGAGRAASSPWTVWGLRVLSVLIVVVSAGLACAAPAAASATPATDRAAPAVAEDLSFLSGQEGGGAAATREDSPPVVRSPTVRTPRVEGAREPGGPNVSVEVGGSQGEPLKISGPVGTVLFIGAMTLIPTLLLLMTGFTRILIVLQLLKQALGTQTAPPAHLLTAMAILLTGFVMAPTFERVHREALGPWMKGEIDEVAMMKAAEVPLRAFMMEASREQDLRAFLEMRRMPAPETPDEIPLVVLTSAFVTSELTSAFQMGFAIFLPFVVIDLVVASVLMSMGMFMLPPVMVSLPFKLLLFVLVDGWSLVLGSLVRSF
ncbi:MAG: flagellar type III secretion system pore protein FliP [Gemmatimonadota bacterium]